MLDFQPLTVAGLTTVSTVVYWYGKRYYETRRSDVAKVQRVPGGHWLWGHEQEAWVRPSGEFYTEHADKLGLAYTIKGAFLHDDILVLTDPAALSQIFTKRVYNYEKSSVIRPLIGRLLGQSLVWAEGDDHKRLRPVLNPVFSTEMVKGMEDAIRTASDKLVASLQTHILASSEKETRINILDWATRATLDIIGNVGFGHDFGCGNSLEAKEISRIWRHMVQSSLEMPGFVGPIVLRTFPFITSLPVTAIQAQGEIKMLIKSRALEIVENRKKMGSPQGKDLLSILIRDNENTGQSLDQLLDHIVTFVFVGFETTSAVLNFTLYELGKDKASQDRLRQEIMEFVGSGRGGEPTYEEYLNKLPFLDAVCKEAFRVHPPASHSERIAVNDDVLPLRTPITSKSGEQLTSIKINKGQLIYVPSISINRSKAAWGPDAEEFRPERWLNPDGLPPPASLTQGWSGIFTFLEGPRICLGYRLALFEYKIILCSLIKNFEFTDTGANIVSHFAATLQPRIVGEFEKGVQLPSDVKLVS